MRQHSSFSEMARNVAHLCPHSRRLVQSATNRVLAGDTEAAVKLVKEASEKQAEVNASKGEVPRVIGEPVQTSIETE